MNIVEKRIALEAIISEAQVMLLDLRKECSHPVGFYKYKGDSGNWCEDDDSYWKEMTCCDCERRWIEEHKVNGVRNDAYHNNPQGDWKEVR